MDGTYTLKYSLVLPKYIFTLKNYMRAMSRMTEAAFAEGESLLVQATGPAHQCTFNLKQHGYRAKYLQGEIRGKSYTPLAAS